MSKRFPPPVDDKEIMIHHGFVTHSLLDSKLGKCKSCKKNHEEFERKIKKAGGIEKFLEKLRNENSSLA